MLGNRPSPVISSLLRLNVLVQHASIPLLAMHALLAASIVRADEREDVRARRASVSGKCMVMVVGVWDLGRRGSESICGGVRRKKWY